MKNLTNMTRLARLSGVGLGIVLLLLATFALSAALLTNRTVTRATKSATLSAAYERARFGSRPRPS